MSLLWAREGSLTPLLLSIKMISGDHMVTNIQAYSAATGIRALTVTSLLRLDGWAPRRKPWNPERQRQLALLL